MFSLKLRKILLSDLFFIILLIFSFVYLIIYHFLFDISKIYNYDTNYFEIKINNYYIDGDKLTLEFDNLVGMYYFKNENEIKSFKLKYSLGDIIRINGNLSFPNNNTIPNTFNYKNYLYHKNIEYILHIDNFSLISKNKNIFLKIKNYIYKRIDNIKYNDYLYAFILGKSSNIDKSAYNNYKTNGITHLFALSGLHVSLFSSIILSLLKRINTNEKVSFIITSLFLIFFSFIASFAPSILRATIFFIISEINKIYYFYIKPKNILYLTFTTLIFINPHYIFNMGFILSFTITFFILLYNENNNKSSILKISVISFLSSLPIIINMSYEINIIGFFNNLFFIPYVSYIVFPFSLLCLVFNKLSHILNFTIIIMEFISKISSNLLNITICFSKISFSLIIVYYFLLILIIKKIKKARILFIILIIFMYLKPYLNKEYIVYFNDVKQGDSILMVLNNKSILIDTGGITTYHNNEWSKRNRDYNLMVDSLIPFYKSVGLKQIDYLILSHGDYDHMGEAINLVNNFKVEKVIFNCGPYNDLEKELIKVLDKKKTKYYSCIKELNIDNNKLYFLQTKEYDNENDNSNVIYIEFNNYKFMFMGDASITTETEILNKYNLHNIDVLKVGHHGSRTSSSEDFINKINPRYSIISVGKNNRYGHPDKEVLNNLENSKIYRTDEDGSVMFKIKNNKLKVETCSP